MAQLDDADRLRALAESALLARASALLDRYVRIARAALGVPIAVVSLVDDRRQFFSSAVGLGELRETPLRYSFCQHVVTGERPLVITDARTDSRVAGNPAIAELAVIAYAGIPIRTADGLVLGSFCAVDHQPKAWSARDLEVLAELAAAVGVEVDERRRTARAERSERELAELADRLEARTDDVTRSAQQTSHDLRSPLQVIEIGVARLREHAGIAAYPELGRVLDMIERNAAQASAIVAADHAAAAIETVDLRTLVDAACSDLQHHQAAIELRVDGSPPGTALVTAAPAELRRCIDNLVTNAQRFAGRQITVRVRHDATTAALVVEDDGPGLPSATSYAEAWTARTRFHAAEGKSGTGLGLAIVRAIVERSGGTVQAGSSPLGGAAFGFALPRAAP